MSYSLSLESHVNSLDKNVRFILTELFNSNCYGAATSLSRI